MAKASYRAAKDAFRWRFLASLIQDLRLADLAAQAIKISSLRRWSGPGGWLLITTGVVAMLYWNGRLVFATGAGVTVMLLVHLMHNWKPEQHLAEIRKVLSGWNQPFVVSVGVGAGMMLATYLATSIWAESDSPWLASGAILQGLGTLAVLVLLVGQW
ncbi:MAG: hypothetical protein HC866_16750 [Leptolyngbyaceae cyanobacterium RU_5_1]|nr:hypothetical protein [Leptolyngbyaceae cyanobacterium RU_5_1]